ncbi:hypothetical protein RND71_026130 [Anisodus tanguticus]|uniref:Myb-like domain-containing protein n=1 Tax=Anisodus tanguticus TaxID=243964 RepID=A0AAE1V821_9SOLA|nr:hypothetical protein RND71_026130 [Anisodus tanguticus]
MSSKEMSMDSIMEDSDCSVSNTDAIIYGSSAISGRTQSLISDPNIPNSSSTSEDEYQQHISTAAGSGGTDDNLVVSSCASSSWFKHNNNKQSEHQEIRIFNVDFRALSKVSYVQETKKSKAIDNLTVATELQMPTSRPLPKNHVPFYHQSSSSVRFKWTSYLHARFVHAVELLGGHEMATPNSILELMDIEDLNRTQVKNHLQMYRVVNYGGATKI